MKLNSKIIVTIILTFLSSVSFALLDGIYIRPHGGAALINDIDMTFTNNISADYHLGYQAGLAAGYKTGSLRYEIEYNYIRAKADTVVVNGTQQTTVAGHSALTFGSLNMLYNFESLDHRYYPFVGFGLGVVHLSNNIRATNVTIGAASTNEIAYQLIAGVGYKISTHFSSELEYRFLATSKFRLLDNSNAQSRESFFNNSVDLALAYSF